MDQETKRFFKTLTDQPGNKVCIDCDAAHPQWASISYGTYFCLNCSGVHRSLGVHLSFVRSISMDTWSDKQKKMMELGGNAAFKQFAVDQGIDKMSIRDKYNTVAAEYYRNMLKAKYDGAAPPALPAPGTGKNLTSGGSAQAKPVISGGFGSGGAGPRTPPNQENRGPNRDYGLSYQGNSGGGGNPYAYNGAGGGNQWANHSMGGLQGLLSSASAAANQFANQAGESFNKAKIQAKDEGWFDFDNIQEQASSFARQAEAKVREVAGSSGTGLTPPRQQSPPPGFPRGEAYQQPPPGFPGGPPASGKYQGFGSNNAPAPSHQQGNVERGRPAASSASSPAPAPVKKTEPIKIREKSPPRVDRKGPNLNLNAPDLSKTAAKGDAGKKEDIWDTDKWFDDM